MTDLPYVKRAIGVVKKRGSRPLTGGDVYSLRVGGRAAKKEGKETCVSATKLCPGHLNAFIKQYNFLLI